MRRALTIVVAVLSCAGAARADEIVDPGGTGLLAQRQIANFGWGLTAGTDGFGKLELHAVALGVRGTLGPHHRHFTTLGAVDGTLNFRDDDPIRRVRLRGIDTLVLYSHDHIGYYARHESEWGGMPARRSHLGEAGFAFHFFDDPSDPYTGYAALTFGLGWDTLAVRGERESGLVVPVGVRVLTDPIAPVWLEASASGLARIHGSEGNHGARIEGVGHVRVHRGQMTTVSIVGSWRSVIEPARFESEGRIAEHIASLGMEGSF
ncbi:MAG: hypothetical protein HYY06_14270 [Deltaproteobacteria bacterium]|nr:hypothetical protein [Deltaproteobacteria bacterium]